MKIPKIPLKAMKAKEVPLDKLEFPLIGQLKYDGVRLITIIQNGNVLFRTYNGSIVPLPQLSKQLKDLGNVMLDGEICLQGGRMGSRPAASGMINSAMHGGTINEGLLSYYLFDSMPLTDFVSQHRNQGYIERYAKTGELANQAYLPIARNEKINSPKDVMEVSEYLYNDGYEGLILKPHDHLYTFTRHKSWVKIKETKTVDLLCVGTTPGTGKYEGMIGALVLSGIAEGKTIMVKAGSGMNDYERGRPPAYYIGGTIETKYNTIIQDSRTGEWSLFLPRFVCVRFDK